MRLNDLIKNLTDLMRRAVLISLCVTMVFSTASFAQSAPEATPYDIANNIVFIGGAGLACSQATGTGFPLHGENNIEKAFWFFIAKGLTDFQSAGIVGNLIVESGGKLDPTIKEYGGGPGRGIAQWTVDQRWAEFLAWAPKQNPPLDPLTLEGQLAWLWYEITEVSPWKKALPAVKASSDVYEAAAKFMILFEKPANQSLSAQRNRGEIAKTQVLDVYGGGSSVSGGGTGGCAASGGAAIVDGFAFPLITTQKVILDNSPRWCYSSQANCHQYHNAADIFAPTGTRVVATVGGRIVGIDNGSSAHLTVVGENYIYYYNHMAAGSLGALRENQPVGTGDPLGNVGTETDALGKPAHLHFDMLARPPYQSRPGCSDVACSSLPFLNVQPALLKSYGTLPAQ